MPKLINTTELSFELKEEIGAEGKNSTVYKAIDIQLNAEMVVKKIQKNTFSDINEFFNEATLLHLGSHPNVVPINYACQDNDFIYLAMPYFSNGSLKNKISNSPLSVRDIVIYTTQICSGLHNIHSKGLIHFDVKPDNILLSNRGEAMISDFGLAKQTTYSGIAGQDRIYGKMAPPEAFQTDQFTNQFDLYQLGLTIHRMCVGDTHFYADFSKYNNVMGFDRAAFKFAVVNGRFPNLDNYPEHIPQKLLNTIKKCLQTDQNLRYKSALDIVNDIADLDGELLDWVYTVNVDSRKWYKQLSDGRQYEILLDNNATSVAKKTSVAGNTLQIKEFTKNILQRSELKAFLRKF